MLALVTGFAAMFLYYYGLRSTPAVAATIAELAFPITAILVGYFKFGQVLTALPVGRRGGHERRRRAAACAPADAGVPLPAPVPA